MYFIGNACTAEEWTCTTSSSSDQVSTCDSPEVLVSSITPNNGTSQEIITITGVGFSTEDCNNIISFGGQYPTIHTLLNFSNKNHVLFFFFHEAYKMYIVPY